MKKLCFRFVLILAMMLFFSCEHFLDEKPRSTLAVPTTVKDFQALLDQYVPVNESDPGVGEASAGDCYLTDADYLSRTDDEKAIYTWKNHVLAGTETEWAQLYQTVYRANTVIDGLSKIELNTLNRSSYEDVLGQAYYIRGRNFLYVLANYTKAYSGSAETDLGIPLRLSINFNEKVLRSNVAESYAQVLVDLKKAVSLLPVTPLHVQRASKPAAYGLLSRVYLLMGDIPNTKLYADSCLRLKSDLLNYNTLNSVTTYPFPVFNNEVLTASRFLHALTNISRAKVVADLYDSYGINDLRKTLFFRNNNNGSFGFRGSYDGSAYSFSGIAVDEVMLNRAEANCRLNALPAALADLNGLLRSRFRTGTFTDYAGLSQTTLLQIILSERRKELVMRGLRWGDIKRLNVLGANIGLVRTVSGQSFVLSAGSPRFALPIPDQVVLLGGVEQNVY